MEKGRIIYLNGVTSSGKTSIVRAIQARDDVLFYAVSFDMFEDAIPERLGDEQIYYSEAIVAMYHAARVFSDFGRNVLIDGLIMKLDGLADHNDSVRGIFRGYPLQIVEVYCPLEICRQRNIIRGDRRENQSEQQYGIMDRNVRYSCSVDTSRLSVEQCADSIINKCMHG